LTFRIHDRTRAALEQAGAENGRSLSEEAESRIESTFRDQQFFEAAAALRWGRELGAIVLLVGDAMHRASKARPEHLSLGDALVGHHHQPWYYDQMRQAADHVLAAFAAGDVVPPSGIQIATITPEVPVEVAVEIRKHHEERIRDAQKNTGRHSAEATLAAALDRGPVRDMLGELAERPLRKRPDALVAWTGALATADAS
jgi:hypothetical protein